MTTPCVDTVGMYLPATKSGGVDFMKEVPRTLDAGSLCECVRQDTTTVIGTIGNLNVSVSPYRVAITKGSLCKWYKGDNLQSLSLDDTRRAIEKLSDTLRLDMRGAIITRLDYGQTIEVENTPASYLNQLGELEGALKGYIGTNLYYDIEGGREKLCFYDKTAEHNSSHTSRRLLRNYLRYEQRYLSGDIGERFGVTKFTASMLYVDTVDRELAKVWRNHYTQIEKKKKGNIKADCIMSMLIDGNKEQQELDQMVTIAHYGIESYIDRINKSQKAGKIDKATASRLRGCLNFID